MSKSHPVLPWLVWGVAAFAYAVAVINRSSLAALGPATQHHFGIDATTLASFAVIQLIVYAAMQIPVGVLLDRFGSTVLIVSGGILMSLGQLAMATVHDVSLAILARVLVGMGDACTFISVIRMLPDWFSLRQLATVSQLTGLIGQAGQLVAVAPLSFVVSGFGWASGFMSITAVTLLTAIAGMASLRDKPGQGNIFERISGRVGHTSRNATSLGAGDSKTEINAVAPPNTGVLPVVTERRRGFSFFYTVKRLLSVPGIRLAYWLHFSSPFAATTLVLLWGTPFLTGGVGLSAIEAAGLLNLTIVAGMTASLLLGPLSSRFVERRVWMNFYITVTIMFTWLAVLLWPGTPPVWLLAILMVVVAVGGPASLIAFEVSRSHTPRRYAGFSTGLVNSGGFTSALLVIYLVGVALDLQGAGSPDNYSLTAFKWAFALQIPFWLLGLTMMFIEERRTKRWMQQHGRTLR